MFSCVFSLSYCFSLFFLVPELKGEIEASDGYQAGNVNNVALHVIGMHGSGDKISLFLQDWEMAKVAFRCRMAVQGNVRSGKETWLVRALSASCVTEGGGSE